MLVLEDAAYDVIATADGQGALDTLEKVDAALIVLNLVMPRLDGITFAQRYHARPGPHAPIIVVTASRDPSRVAQQIGAVASLAKPFGLDEFLALVNTLLLSGD